MCHTVSPRFLEVQDFLSIVLLVWSIEASAFSLWSLFCKQRHLRLTRSA